MKIAKSRHVTMNQIAQEVGIARSTVSLVLNGHARRLKIAERTVQRILDAAKALNYIPNDLARSLRLQKSGVVGLILGNLHHGLAQGLLEGMISVFEAQSYVPFLTISHWDLERERMEIHSLIQRRVDGIILSPLPGNEELYRTIAGRDVPLVLLADMREQLPEVSCVGWDSERATEAAVRHLLAQGRRRIAFFGPRLPTPEIQARYGAYCRVLAEAGLPLREEWIDWEPIRPSVEAMVDAMIQRLFRDAPERPDALFILDDGLALPALAQMQAAGIGVPREVAVIGLGDFPSIRQTGAPLSTVRQPLEEMGREAAQAILELIQNPGAPPIRRLIQGEMLVLRGSTGS